MAEITVNVSDDLKHFVDLQVDGGRYGNASEYVGRLLARAKEGKQRLDSLLIEGLDSNDPIPLDDAEWSKIRSEVHDRLTE